MSSIETRQVMPVDLPVWKVLRLRALAESPEAFGSLHSREAAFTEEEWQERTIRPGGISVLASVDGSPAGIGGGFRDLPGCLHVVAMWTAPEHRSVGVGTAVLAHLELWADDEGLRLHLDVAESNPRARSVYERYGFVTTGESRPIRDGANERVVRMVLARSVSGTR